MIYEIRKGVNEMAQTKENSKMKILGISGSHKRDKLTSVSWYLLNEALSGATDLGAVADSVHLRDLNIIPCEGCSKCMGGGTCPLLDDEKDDTLKLVEKIRWADAIIFSFPVYGLHAAGILTNFIGGRAKAFLGEDLVVSGQENFGKSSLFRGKLVGLIANGGGFGMEMSFLTIWPALWSSKAIPVACVGLSTFEYQKVHFIEQTPVGKRIEEAQWAKNMSRSVGERVYDAYYSKARPIMEGMMGIKDIKGSDEIEKMVDEYGLVWTADGIEEFNKTPVFAREVALKLMVQNFQKLGFTEINREAVIKGREKFCGTKM